MNITYHRCVRFALLCLITFVSIAFAQPATWQTSTDTYPTTTIYTQTIDGDETKLLLKVSPLASINEANGGSLIEDANSDDYTLLEDSLSVLWIDIFETIEQSRSSSNQPILIAYAGTEDGEAKIIATLQDIEGEPNVLVLVAEESIFDTINGSRFFDTPWSYDAMVANLNSTDNTVQTTQAVLETTATVTTPTAAVTQSNNQSYPPPFTLNSEINGKDWAGWSSAVTQDAWTYAKAGDPNSPRVYSSHITLTADTSAEVALRTILGNLGVVGAQPLGLEPLEVVTEIMGNNVYVTLGQSKLNGQDALFFIQIDNKANSDIFPYFFIEAPATTFREWGGVGAMLVATKVVDNADMRNATLLEEIGNTSLEEQIIIFERAYTANMQNLYLAYIATQTGITQAMTELNYDLLFGNDIGTPFLGD